MGKFNNSRRGLLPRTVTRFGPKAKMPLASMALRVHERDELTKKQQDNVVKGKERQAEMASAKKAEEDQLNQTKKAEVRKHSLRVRVRHALV